jgi:hypothetical protein
LRNGGSPVPKVVSIVPAGGGGAGTWRLATTAPGEEDRGHNDEYHEDHAQCDSENAIQQNVMRAV